LKLESELNLTAYAMSSHVNETRIDNAGCIKPA